MIERLRELNPGVRILNCTDAVFERYGRVLVLSDGAPVLYFLDGLSLPDEGVEYRASVTELEALTAIERLRTGVFGGLGIQAGVCAGKNSRMNAMEWHKSSEVVIAGTDLLLFLGLPSDLYERRFDPSRAYAFYLPRGTAVELFPLVLHFAPVQAGAGGFRSAIVLPTGTNLQLDDRERTTTDPLLRARNKWLVAHPESRPAADGAYVGISGDNPEIITD